MEENLVENPEKRNWINRYSDITRHKIVDCAKGSLWKQEGIKALTYLREKRGLTDEIIKQFEFGYCPRQVNHQYRGRFIFPMCDVYGQLVALITKHPDKNHPHPFLHEEFDKSFHLFGLNHAWKHIVRTQKVIVVEGELDVACSHSHGFPMTVGTSGSSFSIFHVCLLARFCSNVYLVFDGDEAGKRAIKRSLEMSKNYFLSALNINIIPVYLPDKKDPDELIMNDVGSYKELLRYSSDSFFGKINGK